MSEELLPKGRFQIPNQDFQQNKKALALAICLKIRIHDGSGPNFLFIDLFQKPFLGGKQTLKRQTSLLYSVSLSELLNKFRIIDILNYAVSQF